jgi:hypothetical protein
MKFKTGDLIRVWDWTTDGKKENTIHHHGKLCVVVRHTKSSDTRNGHKFGKTGADKCWLVIVPNKGLVHVHEDWMCTVGAGVKERNPWHDNAVLRKATA